MLIHSLLLSYLCLESYHTSESIRWILEISIATISKSFARTTILPGSIISTFLAWITTRVSPSKWFPYNSGTCSFFSMPFLQYSFWHPYLLQSIKSFHLLLQHTPDVQFPQKVINFNNSFNNLSKSLGHLLLWSNGKLTFR